MTDTSRAVTYFSDIGTMEQDVIQFDFTSWTTVDLITGTPVITLEVHAGEDPAPALLVGGPVVDVTNRLVNQRVQGTLDGVSYCVTCTAMIGGMACSIAGIIKSVQLC